MEKVIFCNLNHVFATVECTVCCFSNKISTKAWVKKVPSLIPPFFTWEANGKVKDSITGKSFKYQNSLTKPNIYKKIVLKTKQAMFNKLKAEFMEPFQASFSLHKFKPGQEKELI